MEWLQVIKTIAPTVASALGSPLAGVAVSALGSLFGIETPTQEKIKSFVESSQMTGEQIMKMRELEMKYKAEEDALGFKYAELELRDVDSARDREIRTGDNTNKILAYVIVGAFIAVTVATLMGWAKAESVLAGTLIGYVSAKCEQVLSYYFGTNKNSARKTEIIAKSSPIK